MPPKPSTSIRITDHARTILKEASAALGISQAAVMELALRKFWTDHPHPQKSKTMSSKTMNRQQFAETIANAYVDQFASNSSPVMNQRIIVFDGKNFGSQSSLTPTDDNEVIVMSLESGCFGDVDDDDPEAQAWISAYLVDSASDEIWDGVLTAIEEADDDE